MTKMRLSFRLAIILLYSLSGQTIEVHAQSAGQDSSYILPTTHITSSKIRQSVAGGINKEWHIAQLEKLPAGNLAELLNTEAGTYIKSYGQGSLATSSVRGGSAGHTLVLWNGLPIQSPMLGLLDLALLPVNAVETINFNPGGNTAMWGSGAIGGVVNMDNEADFSQQVSLKSSTEFGSFGQFQQQLKLGLGNQKLQSVTKFSHQQAKNDFYYFLANGIPERKQTNARLSQQFLGQDLYWKMNDRNQLTLHLWWQQSDRQIPPTNVQNRSESHQDDLTTRLLVEYKHIGNKGIWNVKTAYFEEHLNYFDDQILLESRNRFRTFLAEITGQWFWNKHEMLAGIFNAHTRAWSAGYKETIPVEYKTALFGSWKYKGEKWQTQLSLRQEMVDEQLVPIVPAFGVDWRLIPMLTLKGKISRNYRLPTLNDRFWIPGGNPDLLPESGWSQELTLVHESKKNNFQFEVSLTTFNRNIDNWILWSLKQGQTFWSANNMTKVWSRGLEPRLSVSYRFKNLTFQWRGGYDHIRSTNQVALNNPQMAVGDQLIYTPVHQASGSFSIEWNQLYLGYQHHFTGKAEGINDLLNAFQTGNVRGQYTYIFKHYKGIIYLNINNIWDADYLVIERRPMPGIHFETGIHFFFTQNK